MKQGCGGAAKIARLQYRPLQKMVNQTAFNKIVLLVGSAGVARQGPSISNDGV